MLKISNLSLNYGGKKILDNINLSFKKGEVTVITGCSGSGKSTIIKLINGIVPNITKAEISGDIIFNKEGNEINLRDKSIEDRSEYISTVFQNPKNQFYTINSLDEMAFALENRNLSRKEIYERINYYSKLLDTEKLLNRDIFKLSGGEKQMVAITSVACMDQDIYLFDEPSSSLDSEHINRIGNAIKELKKLGKTVIIAEHRLFYLRDIMDKLCIIKDGAITEIERDEINNECVKKYNLRNIDRIEKEDLVTEKYHRKNLYEKEYNKENDIEFLKYKYKYPGMTRKGNVFDMNLSMGKDITFIIGENGIGKTTFVRSLCKLNKGFRGRTYYNEELIKNASKYISLVMQDVNYQLFTESVWEEISIVTNDEDKIIKALKELGLYDKRESHPQSLSGGEKQRLSIAMCKASEKPIVIFDEPTSGLCKKNMKRTIGLMHRMKAEGKKIIIVTHDFEFIKECGGEIIEFLT